MAWFDPIVDRIRGRPPIVSVVPLRGIIGGLGPGRRTLNLDGLAPILEAAFRPKHVTAVALVINSPGGSPVQSDLIASRVRDLSAETRKPVVAFVEDLAASGGYWIACAADEIFVNPASIVGSIGVVTSGFGFVDAIEKLGIERRLYTAGTRKALLDPFSPEKEEDVAHLKTIHRELHALYIDWVRERRGDALKPDDEPEMFEGKFWTGQRGIELGLVDGPGEVRRTMRGRYGDKTRFRVLRQRRSLLGRFGIESRMGTVGSADLAAADWAAGLVTALDDRAHWARFGL